MKYLVELTPMGSYFFGGEVTFGESEEKQDYFVKSNLLPQASSILGLIRYEVLRQNKLLSYDPKNFETLKKVRSLIGGRGFNLKSPAPSHGIIRKISPVFLTEGSHYYTPMPLDQNINVQFDESAKCCFSGREAQKGLKLCGYNYKKYDNYLHWCDKDGNSLQDVLNADGEKNEKKENIFTLVEQIGINLYDKTENEKDAFFKQQLVRLHPRLKFVFTVDIAEPEKSKKNKVKFKASSTFCMLGGNRSMFKMTISPNESVDFQTYFQNLKKNDSILLLSDAYLSEEVREKCLFIWGECLDFRNIKNKVYRSHSWKKPEKTVLFHLLRRGSVIYGGDIEDIKNENLSNIGLNVFI